MSVEFDPSPRASKRRRTRYGSHRTLLPDNATNRRILAEQPVSHDEETGTSVYVTSPITQDACADKRSPKQRTQRPSRTPTAKPKARTGGESKSSSKDAGGAGHAKDSDTPETPSGTAREERTTSSQKSLASGGPADIRINGDGASDRNEQAGDSKGKENQDAIPQPRSSGRQRRPPRRLEDTLVESAKPASAKRAKTSAVQPGPDETAPASPVLKGILTPSKKQRTGPRKSVMFNHDEKEIEEQLGFRDIDTPAKPMSKSTTRKATPHPRRSKRIDGIEEEPETPLLENEFEPNVDDNVFDDMPVDKLTVDVSLPNVSTKHLAAASSMSFLEDDPHLQEVKSMVLARLTTTSVPLKPPSHLEKQHAQLHSLLRSTVTASESNSLLLLGPRGAGKSMLLDLALKDLESAHPNDFHVVHLNGFLQTDDRLALREIWRQLGHSRDLDETETEDIGASYADTMASLLSLLSHPDEMTVDPVSNIDVEALAQEASVIAGGGQKTSKSIVFILDEFDLFTTHPRQTLLYNLFDIAQSRKAPIAVIGCSTRMDVIECLEKRVKSRFSHRWLLVPGVKNIAEWNTCVEDALLLDASDEAQAKRSKDQENWVQMWNSEMKKTFLPSKEIQSLIQTHFYTTKSLPDLFMALFPSIATLQIPISHDPIVIQAATPPTIPSTLPELPVLHLSLLTAMSRLETIHHLTTSNFNLVYAHYTELIGSSKLRQSSHGSIASSASLRQWSRELCRGAWEEIAERGLIVPAAGGRDDDSGGQEDETRMWRCEVGLEDVEWSVRLKFGIEGSDKVGGAGEVLLRWCREV